MTRLVVDSSVAVKWFVPEVHSERAALLLSGGVELAAPDLLLSEFGNILWKKHRRGELTSAEVRDVAAALDQVPLRIEPTADLLPAALEIAMACDRTVYDSIFVALASRLGCRLVTADKRLVNALASREIGSSLLWLGDLDNLS